MSPVNITIDAIIGYLKLNLTLSSVFFGFIIYNYDFFSKELWVIFSLSFLIISIFFGLFGYVFLIGLLMRRCEAPDRHSFYKGPSLKASGWCPAFQTGTLIGGMIMVVAAI